MTIVEYLNMIKSIETHERINSKYAITASTIYAKFIPITTKTIGNYENNKRLPTRYWKKKIS